MGLFQKIKKMFSFNEKEEESEVVEEETIEEEIDEETEEDDEESTEEEIDEETEVVKEKTIEEEIDEETEENDEESTEEEIDEETEKTQEETTGEDEDIKKDDKVLKEQAEIKKDNASKKGIFFKREKKDKQKKKEIDNKVVQSVKVYEKGLTKSRQGFVSRLSDLTNKYNKVNEEYFEELEEILIMADIGINTVMSFMERLRKRVRDEKITDPTLLKEVIVDELFIIYVNDEVLSNKLHYNDIGPTVFLFIGVNGVGKTTTIGKLAYQLKQEGKKVLLVGADTFRAGAVNQLREWSEKVDVGFFGKEDSDPSSVVYDGIVKAKDEKYDVVLVDTAGRLQNKVNLMKELEKMNKVIDGLIAGGASETLLILDATTGQNGISQAKAFKEITNITGIVLTKLDGTAKGGIVLAIKEEVGIPVKYIGLGEAKEDLQVFDIEKYIYGLFKDMM